MARTMTFACSWSCVGVGGKEKRSRVKRYSHMEHVRDLTNCCDGKG
jgi:hypothetical protein